MSLKTVKKRIYLITNNIDATLPLYFVKDDVTIKIIEVTKRIVFFKKIVFSTKIDSKGHGLNRDITYEWEELEKFVNNYGEYVITYDKIHKTFF